MDCRGDGSVIRLACRGPASRQAERSGILEARLGFFRTGRNVSFRKSGLERYELLLNSAGGGRQGFAGPRGRGGFPTYAELMTAGDGAGKNRSYLETEDAFRFVKDLHSRNLIIPVVGNFGGPKALLPWALIFKARPPSRPPGAAAPLSR